MKFEEARTIEELIEMIFEEVMTLKLHIEEDGKELHGHYLSLPKISKCELVKSPQITRLFYNAYSATNKVYGENNQSDKENLNAQALLFLYEALTSALVTDNDRLEERLRVNDVSDAIRILNDEKLCANLCKWCITYINMKTKTYIKDKSNVDYFYNGKEFERIDYVYMDKENEEDDGISLYEKLNIETFDSRTGDLTEYILDTYWDKLTSKQQLWAKCYLEFGTDKSGFIRSLDDSMILYIPQECVNYKAVIRKRLWKLIENDNHIDIVNGRMIYRD